MPRYHFDFTRPDGVVLSDEAGMDLPDIASAKAHLRSVIRNAQREAAPELDWSEWIATIRAADSEEVAVVRFKDVAGLRVA